MQASSDVYTQTRRSLYEIAVEIIIVCLLNDVYRYRYMVSEVQFNDSDCDSSYVQAAGPVTSHGKRYCGQLAQI